MDLDKLKEVLAGEPKFRLKQAYQAIFTDLIADWRDNTTLPPKLREKLDVECPLELKATLFGSKNSESLKILLELADGGKVESVLLKHADGRRTVCVSAQVGCPLGCKFCATGMLGFKRNLSTDEIVAQVLFFSRYLKRNETEHDRVTNVVFMGMGEPLLNYDSMMEAVRILNSKDAFNIGARRISISTAGIIPGVEKLMREDLQINLAISLHAATDELRSELMPINNKYPLEDLMKVVARFARAKNREVMFEYLLIKGINDRREDALALVDLMRIELFMVNLIRYNPTGVYGPSNSAEIARFKNILSENGINVTQRYSFGQDINAACGQLANKNQ
ncbi:MAG: 23S rRNA (adenine(2503)-C(2))-methyltransferase RlmN [Candidatus Pacebacteria bacterium]|nr:23S rRNA (adenine(2503)-C(2))-methyltransferase RlmN [Candidatus Paceibacterota bacterium]